MEKNNNSKLIMILLVLIIAIMGGYIVYSNIITKEEKEVNKNLPEVNNKVEQKEDLTDVSNTLVNFLEKNHIRYITSYTKDKTFTDSTVNDNFTSLVLEIASGYLDNKNTNYYDSTRKISGSKTKEYFKRAFNITLAPQDITCFADKKLLYKYDSNQDMYITTGEHEHEAISGGNKTIEPDYTKVVNIEKQNDEYILTTHELYINGINSEVTADAAGKVKIFNLDKYMDDEMNIDNDKIIQDYETTYQQNKSKYPTFKYTFKKNSNNQFYLAKYEQVK